MSTWTSQTKTAITDHAKNSVHAPTKLQKRYADVGGYILANTTTPSDGFDRSLNKIVVPVEEKPTGFHVWVYDGLLFSVGPGRARLGTVRIFETVEDADNWANSVRQYEVLPVGEIPKDAEPASVHAVRQLTKR